MSIFNYKKQMNISWLIVLCGLLCAGESSGSVGANWLQLGWKIEQGQGKCDTYAPEDVRVNQYGEIKIGDNTFAMSEWAPETAKKQIDPKLPGNAEEFKGIDIPGVVRYEVITLANGKKQLHAICGVEVFDASYLRFKNGNLFNTDNNTLPFRRTNKKPTGLWQPLEVRILLTHLNVVQIRNKGFAAVDELNIQ